jgi:cyanobactin cluster PatC/TenC/TruC protein
MTEVKTATLWQIGKPGGGGKEFAQDGGWLAEFTYTVGSDADPINKPNMPPVLVKAGLKPKLYCTKKLNIRFTLNRDYSQEQLTFYYDFLGAETDSIFINGKKLRQIKGAGEGKLKQNQILLPALNKGENVLSITTAGGADGAHWIDYLKLESRVTSDKQGATGMSSKSGAEVATSSTNGDRQDNIITSSEAGMAAQQAVATSITTHVPAPGARTSEPGTGLEDYAYWLQEIAKLQAAKAGQEKKPFRRGRIWA